MAKTKQTALRRVFNLPANEGGRIMSLPTDISQFPLAQDTVVSAAQLGVLLAMFLHKHLSIDGETL